MRAQVAKYNTWCIQCNARNMNCQSKNCPEVKKVRKIHKATEINKRNQNTI